MAEEKFFNEVIKKLEDQNKILKAGLLKPKVPIKDAADREEEKEHRQESCNRCGGEGWVMTHYTPATYHDPADVDGED